MGHCAPIFRIYQILLQKSIDYFFSATGLNIILSNAPLSIASATLALKPYGDFAAAGSEIASLDRSRSFTSGTEMRGSLGIGLEIPCGGRSLGSCKLEVYSVLSRLTPCRILGVANRSS